MNFSSSLLVLHSSARITRSITRRLAARFTERWLAAHPGGDVVQRDAGTLPPSPVGEAWIAAAYSPPADRTPEMTAALAESEMLIREIEQADVIVMGVPMYNFGMPAQMKAYLEQIVRSGRTFGFTGDPANPYRPLLRSKPVIAIISTGATGYEPGGPGAALDFLEPQLRAVLALVGLTDLTLVRVSGAGTHDAHFEASLAAAEAAVDAIVKKLAGAESAADAG
ncbi:MAG: hypothetical protein JWO82_2737 [Akkermansiaceae bacterium]|nr:hypothetical protein [Akkermansiaceae bacterium]